MDASSGFSSTSESQRASTKSVPGSELGVSQPPFILRTKQSKTDSYKLCTKPGFFLTSLGRSGEGQSSETLSFFLEF